ncbi:MAG TPA: hypothetical protein VFC07_08590, partial [Verrucomicrobiae bacterium]|nr:hypothetical protein [Verrucomicrobiae bacterium]
DVDAGPVLKGYGCAACAFGVGAARVNGHFEQAYPLTAELLVTTWPLPDGTRPLPRLLSNATDAPLLGEACILFNLTRLPAPGFEVKMGGSIPGFVWIFLALPTVAGLLLLAGAVVLLRRERKCPHIAELSAPRLQCAVWVGVGAAGFLCLVLGKPVVAMLLFLMTQLLLKARRVKPRTVRVQSVPTGQ